MRFTSEPQTFLESFLEMVCHILHGMVLRTCRGNLGMKRPQTQDSSGGLCLLQQRASADHLCGGNPGKLWVTWVTATGLSHSWIQAKLCRFSELHHSHEAETLGFLTCLCQVNNTRSYNFIHFPHCFKLMACQQSVYVFINILLVQFW